MARDTHDFKDLGPLLGALTALIDERVERRLAERASDRGHNQHDGHRPAWAQTALVFLRAWRTLNAEGHPGVSAAGKLRMMTPAAADEWAARKSARSAPRLIAAPVVQRLNVDDEVLAELGARRAVGGR